MSERHKAAVKKERIAEAVLLTSDKQELQCPKSIQKRRKNGCRSCSVAGADRRGELDHAYTLYSRNDSTHCRSASSCRVTSHLSGRPRTCLAEAGRRKVLIAGTGGGEGIRNGQVEYEMCNDPSTADANLAGQQVLPARHERVWISFTYTLCGGVETRLHSRMSGGMQRSEHLRRPLAGT